jgi:hypothetical protein
MNVKRQNWSVGVLEYWDSNTPALHHPNTPTPQHSIPPTY